MYVAMLSMYVTEVQFIAEGLALLLGINVMSLNLLPFNCHVAIYC